MDIDQIIEKLEIRMKRMITFLPEKKRLYFEELKKQFTSRGILLCGPRGTGKTTFLLFMAKEKGFFYISADDPLILQCSFYDLIEKILNEYPGVIVDELHFLKNWGSTIKSFYDAFPNKTIWLSDSSSIVLRKSLTDLSRRFVIINLPLMSLREYVYFETGKILPKIENPFELESMKLSSEILREVDILQYFKSYKENGTRPFYLEGNFKERMMNIIEKIIYYDIPYFVERVNENHFGVMRAILSHLAYSKIPTINVESMCRDWGISKPKLYQLLHVMQKAGLINIVEKEGISKPYSKGGKIFLSDPTMYRVLEGEIGNIREAFLVFALKERGRLWAARDERKGDFIFNEKTLEIGGIGKKSKDSNYVVRDDIDIPVKNIIPMWMLGMIW